MRGTNPELCDNLEMEKIDDIRYKNTRLLINSHCDPSRAIKDFAERIGVQSGYASGMATPNPEKRRRPIGNSMARRIEKAFQMQKYWLDTPHYLEDESHLIMEEIQSYTLERESIRTHITGKQTLPLIDSSKLQQWLNGEFADAGMIQFPVLPMMQLTDAAYVIREKTNSMPPQKPGDFYYVDPGLPPEPGKWVVFIVKGIVVVGIYELGVNGGRLTFTNPRESAIEVGNETYAGRVLTRMDGDFVSTFSD